MSLLPTATQRLTLLLSGNSNADGYNREKISLSTLIFHAVIRATFPEKQKNRARNTSESLTYFAVSSYMA